MSIVWLDSFQSYNGTETLSYGLQGAYAITDDGGNVNLANSGRFSGDRSVAFTYSSNHTNNIVKNIAASAAAAVGVAVNISGYPSSTDLAGLVGFVDTGGNNYVQAVVNSTGVLHIYSTVTDTTLSYTLSLGTWYYIELLFTSGGSGSAHVYVNGTLVGSQTGNYGSNQIQSASFGTRYATFNANNVRQTCGMTMTSAYIANDAASRGDVRVQVSTPSSNSAVSWTPLTGSNYSEVNELPVDGDTSYVYTSTVNNQDLYGVTALTGTPASIKAVQVRTCMRKSDTGSHGACSVISSNGTVVDGATQTLGSSYAFGVDVYEQDPHTSAAWTAAAVDALLIGQKLLS